MRTPSSAIARPSVNSARTSGGSPRPSCRSRRPRPRRRARRARRDGSIAAPRARRGGSSCEARRRALSSSLSAFRFSRRSSARSAMAAAARIDLAATALASRRWLGLLRGARAEVEPRCARASGSGDVICSSARTSSGRTGRPLPRRGGDVDGEALVRQLLGLLTREHHERGDADGVHVARGHGAALELLGRHESERAYDGAPALRL